MRKRVVTWILALTCASVVCALIGGNVRVSAATLTLFGMMTHRIPFERPARSGTLYVSDANAGDVPYFGLPKPYPYRGVLSGAPLGPPFGLAVDDHGSLYVCNFVPNSPNSTVLVYPKGSSKPTRTLSDNDAGAYAVAVGNDGAVYVANLFLDKGGSKQYPGNVLVYSPGSSTPSSTLDDRHFGYVTGVAVDAKNNVFVSYNTALTFARPSPPRRAVDWLAFAAQNSGRVAEFPAGSTRPKELFNIPGPRGNSGVNSLALDKTGNIVVLAYYAGNILVYPPGAKKPSRTFGLDPNGIEESLAFDATGTLLFVPVLFENKVDVFDYRTGSLLGRISDPGTFAAPEGAAVEPRLPLP